MRDVRRILGLFAAIALVLVIAPPIFSAAPSKPRAERPTYALGEKWTRDDGTYELVRIEDDRYVFVADPDREIHLTKDLAIAKVRRGQEAFEWDTPPEFAWPLEVGQWGSRSTLWPARVNNNLGNLTWSVENYEAVRVPAGTFPAFRIEVGVTVHYYSCKLRLWYAPDVRQYVKAELTGSAIMASQTVQLLHTFQLLAVDRPAPLQIALPGLVDQARVPQASLPLQGTVTSGKGVARVVITLNGRQIARHDAPPGTAPRETPLAATLPLQAGPNVLVVTATDTGGTTQQETRTLVYDPPAAAQERTTSAPAAPPFQVNLRAPTDQLRVEQPTLTVAGLVAGGTGVQRVVVSLNGQEVTRHEERTPQRAVALAVPLTLTEGPNTLVVTATEADGTLHQEVRTVHYVKPVPLTVTIRSPEDRARVTEAASVLAALVTSSQGVANVTVAVNGVEVHQQTERTAPKSLVVTAPLTFREGTNTLVVSATEPDGNRRQELRTVIYEKPQPATGTAAAPAARPANRWAVVIGVGRHDHPQIPRLRYAVPDAEAIHRVLLGPGGFKPEHVLLLTETSDRKPTLRNLKWALGTFLARSAQKDDTVLIFFAGHGAPEVDQRGLERDGLAKYLIPSDADPEDLYSTALPMDELQTVFGRLEAERVVVFLDTCYSGAAGGRTFASARTRAVNLDELFLERLTRAKGRAIITASRATEVSLEMAELGHGLFTYYLVQGLQGAADLNRDGIVALQELYEYLEQQVSQRARALGGRQHPVMKGELEGVLPLATVR